MPNFTMPLSWPVNQEINPWTWMSTLTGNQFGLVNINMGKSSNPDLERKILDDVGSYGRQIGQLADALEAVLSHMKMDGWSAHEKEAVDAFRFQLSEVRRLKRLEKSTA